jgi:glucosamine--fructose-6-phosphate aminotransferase (isomerizing)
MRSANEPLPGAPEPWGASEMPAFRSRPPYAMTEMIAAEPALAERLVRRLSKDEAVEGLAASVRDAAAAGRPIVTTGCGTSEHAAMAIAALLSAALELDIGQRVRAIPALELVASPLARGLLIGVSHEGGTEVTNEALRRAADAGAATALLTVSRTSPGATLVDTVVATEEQDQSWCHTVGYLSPLVAGTVLAARLQRARTDGAALRALLDVTHDAHAAASIAASLVGTDRVLVVGAGPDYITARELALKIAEGARLAAAAHELETVLHGHLAAATRWTALLLVLTDVGVTEVVDRAQKALRAARAISLPVAAIMSEQADAQLAAADTSAGRMILPRTGRVPTLAGSLMTSAIALQLLTERLARARGVNPDTLGREDPKQATAHA